MKQQFGIHKNTWILTPVFGSIFFVILYLAATLLYPGGSQVDKNSVGFSWMNNYWCNLLNEVAINGQYNPAKPVAMTGMFVLCLTLSVFWLLFAKTIKIGKFHKRIIQISGIVAMVIACFLFSNANHDLVINLASLFGLIATVGTNVSLYKIKWHRLFSLGLCCLLLVPINNFFYYEKDLIIYLPIIQKVSFIIFIIWICCIDLKMYRMKVYNDTQAREDNGY